MEWMDKVFLAKYDSTTEKIDLVKPFDSDTFFYEEELAEIENHLANALSQ